MCHLEYARLEVSIGVCLPRFRFDCVERKIGRSGRLLPRAPTLISLVDETRHSPMTRFYRCVANTSDFLKILG